MSPLMLRIRSLLRKEAEDFARARGGSLDALVTELLLQALSGEAPVKDLGERRAILQAYAQGRQGAQQTVEALELRDVSELAALLEAYAIPVASRAPQSGDGVLEHFLPQGCRHGD